MVRSRYFFFICLILPTHVMKTNVCLSLFPRVFGRRPNACVHVAMAQVKSNLKWQQICLHHISIHVIFKCMS